LAVLSPDHHDASTAACLVELGMGGAAPLDAGAAAIARGVRGYLGRSAFGRGGERGLDVAAPILSGGILDMLRQIADYLARQAAWSGGVADTTSFPFSAICKLRYTRPSGVSRQATGFYIANDRLLTAGHVAIRGTDGIASMEVHPGMNGTDQFPVVNVPPANVIANPDYLTSRIADNDIAVIKVDTPPPNGLYFNLDPTPASQGAVAICGYAGGSQDSTRQHLDTDMIRNVAANMETADYNASTDHGTSGGPVFYTRAVEDDQAQQSRIDIAVQGVHVNSGSIDGTPQSDALYNKCCLLTQHKLDWIWSV
jgi:V8-like Glu-specific endopeptidase